MVKLSRLFHIFGTDNVTFGTDKVTRHSYGDFYDEMFPPESRDEVTSVLELGFYGGGALLAFVEFFHKAQVVGIDYTNGHMNWTHPRVLTIEGDVTDTMPLVDGQFDVIIDDASHIVEDVWKAFRTYYPHLRSGGVYIIEDVRDDRLLGTFKHQCYDFQVWDNRTDEVPDDRILYLRKP